MNDPKNSPIITLILSILVLGFFLLTVWGVIDQNAFMLIGVVGLLASIALVLGLPVLRKLQFSLRTMMLIMFACGTCVTLLVAKSIELKSLGIVCSLFIFAVTISAIVRCRDDKNRQDDW